MPIFKVLQPLNHNGKPYTEGKTVEMTEEQAEPLLELKAIAPLGAPEESTPPDEDVMVVTQQVSGDKPRDVDPKKAPPSSARVQQQKGAKEPEE